MIYQVERIVLILKHIACLENRACWSWKGMPMEGLRTVVVDETESGFGFYFAAIKDF